jgi:hypothetical protein
MAFSFDASLLFRNAAATLAGTMNGPAYNSTNYTCVAGATLLVVGIFIDPSVANTWKTQVAPTYNGVALSQVDRMRSDVAPEQAAELWYLLNPTTASALPVVISGRDASSHLKISSWKAGTDRTTKLDVSIGSNGTSANPSATLTPTTRKGNVTVQIVASAVNSVGTLSHKNLTPQVDHGSEVSEMQYYIHTDTEAVTMTYTVASNDWGLLMASFKETYLPGKISKIAGLGIASVNKIASCASTSATAVVELGCFGGG